ncbi:MAG: GAF domain-containing protein [Nitrospirota bacterium]
MRGGFDLASQQTRREAIENALDTGKMVISGRIRLVQETGGQYGVLVFMPVYQKGPFYDSPRSRRSGLSGFVLGVFRIGDIIEAGLKDIRSKNIDIIVSDATEPDRPLLYSGNGAGQRNQDGLQWSTKLEVADRQWLLEFSMGTGETGRVTWNMLGVLAGGLLFTILIGMYLLTQERYTARLEISKEAIRLNEARLDALYRLSRMTNASEKELTDFALEECVRLTFSRIGYLHFINEDQKSLRLYSWSKDVLRECSAEKEQHYPLENAGVWADCVRQRNPVIHNDYQSLKDKKGYPGGHIHISRHMSVPVFDNGKIIVVAGVGNKAEPYNESDVRQLSLFMNDMWKIYNYNRMQKERERLISELRDSLAKVRTLSGLLPICSSCKKVRDDRGYWSQIESYVSEHSEAEFSHGICPDCEKKIYDELEKLKKSR